MYLMTAIKPDLAYSVDLLVRFMSNPSLIHQKALHQIWEYVTYFIDFKLTYKSNLNSDTLSGYCDSDCGGGFKYTEVDDRLYIPI
jgi:hypothetical protein